LIDLAVEERFIADAWRAVVAGDADADVAMPDVTVVGPGPLLRSRLPVDDVAVACIVAALAAASVLGSGRRRAVSAEPVFLDRRHAAAAVTSERQFRRGDEPAAVGFAPLSRFWKCADGWVRTHANYPWHRAALLQCLGVDAQTEGDAVADAVAGAIAARTVGELEEAVFAAGGIAAAVRTRSEWLAHPQGAAVAAEPLVACERFGDAPQRDRFASALPADGVRVVDLTRVIAGPVCTRFLGALGADVLRMDPPHRPDVGRPGAVADTLLAKRSSFVDFAAPDGLATLHELLDAADALVCGYRPGALDRFGLSPAAMAERHPGVVVVYLDAWGHTGPWASRRGFDSVVQAPTGVARAESTNDATPGALPCQLLDHGTGYLAAAAVLDGLRRQSRTGGTYVRRLSLARTAAWLLGSEAEAEADIDRWRAHVDSPSGPVFAIAPPGRIGDALLTWPTATTYGTDVPIWLD
jgi:crotonobetainyl-CoA:carnitine CoA-transferase CaiB-like acyl-CoA transferase